MARCLSYGCGSRGNVKLVQDVREMAMDCVIADVKPFGDALVAMSIGHEAQYFDLAFCESFLSAGLRMHNLS